MTLITTSVETSRVVNTAVVVSPGSEVVIKIVEPATVVEYVVVSVLSGMVLITVDTTVVAGSVLTIKLPGSCVVIVST